MGVYIKGMKMPKDHLACPFRGDITEICLVSEKWCNGFNKNCQLVEVKEPHGALIDASVLLKYIYSVTDGEDCPSHIAATVDYYIATAPEVIAEE